MTDTLTAAASLADDRAARFRPFVVLMAIFALVSAAMEILLLVMSLVGLSVDVAIWIRCSFVLASSVVLLLLTLSTARGSRRSFGRVRIISVAVVVAVIVIVSIPGFLPDWVRIEQGVCGGLVLPLAILVNMPRTRVYFPKPETGSVGSVGSAAGA